MDAVERTLWTSDLLNIDILMYAPTDVKRQHSCSVQISTLTILDIPQILLFLDVLFSVLFPGETLMANLSRKTLKPPFFTFNFHLL